MNHWVRMRVALVWIGVSLVWVACGDDNPKGQRGGGPEANNSSADVVDGEDAQDPDLDRDAQAPADLPDGDGDVGLTEAVITGGAGAVVRVSFEPFSLVLEGADGEPRARARQGDEAPYSGVSFAMVESFRASVYHNPTLQVTPNNVTYRWFSLGAVRRGEATEAGGASFEVASVGEAGEAGPPVTLTFEPSAQGVSMRVTLDEDERVVFNNFTLEARDGEGYYGFGEVFDKLDGRGQIREMQIQAEGNSESSTNEVHVPVPFVLSSERYGVYLESAYPSAFDMGATVSDAARVTSLARDLTWHLMVDDDPMAMIERYTDLTGKPAHVPFWALTPQWWRNVTVDQEEVLDDARRSRAEGMPSSVLWIDRPWSSYYHNWRFDTERFPEPEAMFEELERMGYRVLLHHSPQMNPNEEQEDITGVDISEDLYTQFLDNGWLVTTGGIPLRFPWGGGLGGYVDYSDPGAVARVQEHITRVTSLGAIGTKMDWDESLQANLASVRIFAEFENGEDLLTMRLRYSALYHKAIIEGFDRGLGEPSFHVSRSGSPGDQVWNTCIWPGDLDNDFTEHTRGPSERQERWNVGGLPAAIVANQSLGLGGYPCFGSDIGGFRNGDPDEEALLRWMAFGTFNAVMQLGGGGGSHMPWTADNIFSPEALEITRKYFELRMRLVPYIHQHLLEAQRTGRPLVRPLWLTWPDDPETRAHERDFLFGPDLLVAPVFVEGQTVRSLYLPQGRWVDFWSGESLEGGRVVEREVPLDLIPLYVREGALIPTYAEVLDTLMPAEDPEVRDLEGSPDLSLWVAPPASGERTLSLYNGLSAVSARSPQAWSLSVSQGEVTAPEVDPRMALPTPTLTVDVWLAGSELEGLPELERDGEAVSLSEASGDGEALACVDCWRLLPDRRVLRVRLASPDGILRLPALATP